MGDVPPSWRASRRLKPRRRLRDARKGLARAGGTAEPACRLTESRGWVSPRRVGRCPWPRGGSVLVESEDARGRGAGQSSSGRKMPVAAQASQMARAQARSPAGWASPGRDTGTPPGSRGYTVEARWADSGRQTPERASAQAALGGGDGRHQWSRRLAGAGIDRSAEAGAGRAPRVLTAVRLDRALSGHLPSTSAERRPSSVRAPIADSYQSDAVRRTRRVGRPAGRRSSPADRRLQKSA